MKYLVALILFALYLFASTVKADMSDISLGGGYHMGTYDETNVQTANPTGIKIEVGKYFAKNIAFETHFLFGIDSDSVSFLGVDLDIDLKRAISLLFKADYPVSEAVNLYGLLGFTQLKMEATAKINGTEVKVSNEDSGLSYGMGAESGFGNNFIFSAEYILYLSESSYDYSGFNLGLHKEF